MRHVFSNPDDEMIAADTVDQAAFYLDCELGGDSFPPATSGWVQIPDDELITVIDDPYNNIDKKTTKTAREWAADHEVPGYISTTYW